MSFARPPTGAGTLPYNADTGPGGSLPKSALARIAEQIKKIAEQIEPAPERHLDHGRFGPVAGAYSALLSQLDDLVGLVGSNERPPLGCCPINLASVAQNFSEGFSYRFGVAASMQVEIHADHLLPVVVSYPRELILVMDRLVRGLRYLDSARPVVIRMSSHDSDDASGATAAVSLAFVGQVPDISGQEFSRLMAALAVGNVAESLERLGLEFSAGLLLAQRLGARAEILRDQRGVPEIVLRLTLPVPAHHFTVPCFPQDFFCYTTKPAVLAQLERIASFHGVRVTSVDAPEQIAAGSKLVFDASDFSGATRSGLAKVQNPEQTVVLLPANDPLIVRELGQHGFSQFVDFPLVSSRLMRALHGFDPYVPAEPASSTNGSRTGLRVLLVDDTASARIVARNYLEAAGHFVTEASDGVELVRLIESGKRFDVIFSDMTMVHLDGVPALARVRDYERTRGLHTPAVLVTTYTEIASEHNAREAGFDQILRKPLAPEMIAAVLEDLGIAERPILPARELEIIDLEDLRLRCHGDAREMLTLLSDFITASKKSMSALKSLSGTEAHTVAGTLIRELAELLREAGSLAEADEVASVEAQLRRPQYSLETDLARIERIFGDAWTRAEKICSELRSSAH